jgi:hypothetical protein
LVDQVSLGGACIQVPSRKPFLAKEPQTVVVMLQGSESFRNPNSLDNLTWFRSTPAGQFNLKMTA